MSAEVFIALRYLNTQRKGLFTLITTFIGIAGVALGIAALIVTLSIMNGFQSDIKQKILDSQAHIMIYSNINKKDYDVIDKKLKIIKEIESFSPFYLGQALLSVDNRSTGVIVKGLEIPQELKINNLSKNIEIGSWESLNKEDNSLVIGKELADNLGLWLNDYVILVSPNIKEVSLGIIPKMKKFKIKGIINTGYYEVDSNFAFCSLKDASNFFDSKDFATGIGIKLKNIEKTQEVVNILNKELPFSYNIKTYAQVNKNLFSALKLEKVMMSIVLALIIIVATFTITSNLLITSVEKIKEIGILRAMGATPNFIKKVFFYEGIFIALAGIFLGLIIGISVSLFIKTYSIIQLPADIYYITKVPIEIRFLDIFISSLVSFFLCILSAIFPAIRASKINPIEAIRYG